MSRLLLLLALTPLVVACTLTPDYERPPLDVPAQYRSPASPPGESIANLPWWELFKDQQLELLIRTALEQNKDLGIALSRIEESRLAVIGVRADQFPFLNLGGFFGRERASRELFPGVDSDNRFRVGGDLTYQVDLWGQYSRATEAARARLLATESAYRAITISLVTQVANTYLLLRDLDQRLEVAEQTLQTRRESLRIIQARFDKGTVPQLDVYQAQVEVAVAETAIASFARQTVQTENALRILLGLNPGPVTRGDSLASQIFPPSVPVGLPSTLLKRRPDVVQAEAELMAATATVGVAEALRYPSISLTGFYGAESTDLSDFNSGNAETWAFGANLFAPIFNSGQLKAQAEAARERVKQAALSYEGTLQQSFREVEDALVAVRTYSIENEAQSRRAEAAAAAAQLSRARYDGGVVDYLEVLDTERSLFDAQLSQSSTLRLYFTAIVRLYGALGGGWSVE
ncbi:MAG: efflux transporter outer membrane subunit [Halieaceae bacterium]|nr:efflux transporter outer membrane subunit [Halieaceae bacterium]